MKVLQVIRSLDPRLGGPAKVVAEFACLLPALGVETTVATSDHARKFVESTLSDQVLGRVRFHSALKAPSRALSTFGFSIDNIRWMHEQVHRFDVVHFHGLFDGFTEFGMLQRARTTMPYVVSPWGLLGEWALKQRGLRKRAFIQLLSRRNLQRATFVQFSTATESREFEKALGFSVKSVVLPAGVDFSEVSTATGDYVWNAEFGERGRFLRVLYLSRLHKKKGLLEFLHACADLLKRVQLMVAGSGDEAYEAECKSFIRSQHLESHVKFVGHVNGDRKNSALQHADIFILPSFSESQGIVVLEAIAAGCYPVVGEGVAMAEHLATIDYGLSHEYSESAVRNAFQKAMRELPSRDVRAERAKQVFESFDWGVVAQRQIRLYQDAMRT